MCRTSVAIFATLMVLAVNHRRSFVDTAPTFAGISGSPEIVPSYQDDTVVRDLESLKSSLGKSLEMVKTHSEMYTNMNGQQESHSNTKEQLNENGKLIARIGQQLDEVSGPDGNPVGKLHTKVDIPSKGIHKTIEQPLKKSDNGNRRANNFDFLPINGENQEKYNQYSGIQYTPLDMAEYVFWTGDERGVTLALEEFLQEGMLTREEAISFLQEIKYNLDYLTKHYRDVGLNNKERAREKETVPNGIFYNDIKENLKSQKSKEKKNSVSTESATTSTTEDPKFLYQNIAAERFKIADYLYTEYSLEEVIYQMSKIMFVDALRDSSTEGRRSIRRFINFLDIEAGEGRISRTLEKKVLDVLIAALNDVLMHHPELNAKKLEMPSSTSGKEYLYKQMAKLNSKNKKEEEMLFSDDLLEMNMVTDKELSQ